MDRIEAVKVVSRLPESRDPWLALIRAIGITYIRSNRLFSVFRRPSRCLDTTTYFVFLFSSPSLSLSFSLSRICIPRLGVTLIEHLRQPLRPPLLRRKVSDFVSNDLNATPDISSNKHFALSLAPVLFENNSAQFPHRRLPWNRVDISVRRTIVGGKRRRSKSMNERRKWRKEKKRKGREREREMRGNR